MEEIEFVVLCFAVFTVMFFAVLGFIFLADGSHYNAADICVLLGYADGKEVNGGVFCFAEDGVTAHSIAEMEIHYEGSVVKWPDSSE